MPFDDGTYRQLAESILVAHQRAEDGGCMCRDLPLGASWAEHVVNILYIAGALRRHPPKQEEL